MLSQTQPPKQMEILKNLTRNDMYVLNAHEIHNMKPRIKTQSEGTDITVIVVLHLTVTNIRSSIM